MSVLLTSLAKTEDVGVHIVDDVPHPASETLRARRPGLVGVPGTVTHGPPEPVTELLEMSVTVSLVVEKGPLRSGVVKSLS